MAEFSLLNLLPAGHTFRDAEGTVFDVMTARLFGTLQFGRLVYLESELPAAMQDIRAAKGDDTLMIPAVQRLDQVVNEFFQMLVPRMPLDRVYEIPLQDKTSFIEWWQQEEEKIRRARPAGEQVAGKPIRGRRSPASSTRTKSTRNGS